MSESRPILGFYFLLLTCFLGWNLCAPKAPNRARTPSIQWVRTVAGSANDSRTGHLDLEMLRRSMNRLYATTWLRQMGNSLRLQFGQQLSWCLWSDRPPAMLFHRTEVATSRGLASKENLANLDAAVELIVGYNRRLVSEGWSLTVLPVPTKLSIYSDRVNWPLQTNSLVLDPIVDDGAALYYQSLVDRLQAGGVAVVDLDRRFRTFRKAHPEMLLYPAAESHWSGVGIRLAAEACAQSISDSVHIPQRRFTPSYLEVTEIGDLAAGFDPLPAWLSRLRPIYYYHDRLINGEAGKGYYYTNHPAALLAAVGTSYSGQYTWHVGQPVGFPWVLASYLTETEMHNLAVAGQGSFESFRRFWATRVELLNDFRARQPDPAAPRVVVWEFPLRDIASIHDLPTSP